MYDQIPLQNIFEVGGRARRIHSFHKHTEHFIITALSQQALKNLPPLENKESDSIATNTKRKENRKGSDIPGEHYYAILSY
jgi:hypothetical protein